MKLKILFFSPYAYIDVHSLPEAIVGSALIENGHSVFQVICAGMYKNFCVSMSAAQLWHDSPSNEKNEICHQCKLNSTKVTKHFNFDQIVLDRYLSSEDDELIRNLVSQVNVNNWVDFSYQGIPVGRYAAYELLLNYKINNPTLTDTQFNYYKGHLIDSLRTLIAGEKLFREFQPSRLVLYNHLYSTNRMMSVLADRHQIPCFTLHAGIHHLHRLTELMIFKVNKNRLPLSRLSAWDKYSQYALTKNRIERAHQHICELFTAKSGWVYSIKSQGASSAELREFFRILPSQKILLVAMSSNDEIYAGKMSDSTSPIKETSVFDSQMEWIQFLIEYALINKHTAIILRPHPRLFPNKREGVLSAYADNLKQIFKNLPDNVKVNWPKDNISLFDLIKLADVGLNSTSSSGLEMLLLGLPVVNYQQVEMAYPRNLNLCGVDKNDYTFKIESALKNGYDMRKLYEVYRWISFQSDVAAIDISDSYKVHRSYLERIFLKIKKILHISNNLPGLISNKKNLKRFDWLTFAIEKGVDSHIDDFISRDDKLHSFSYDQGMQIILSNFKKITQDLAQGDELFLRKINRILTSQQVLNVKSE